MSSQAGLAPKLNFIRDVAAETDFFGSHDPVAKAISAAIAQNTDLKVIGLLGRWGSGKSTVVKHVQKHLAADTGVKTHVFCYDAWLHQSDPPRRSFLESLVSFLVEEGLTTQDRWQTQLDILNRQIEDTETESTPLLTRSGQVVLLSLALIPLGMHFLGHDWYAAAIDPATKGFARGAFWLGALLLLIPALIAIWTANTAKDGESVLALFVNRHIHRQTNRTTRSPDPTTIEFQKIFRYIISSVYAENRRLIFFIDNLDRLGETEAVSMWNTIRSFFLGKEHVNRALRDAQLPTVLLPIDQDAIQRIYSVDHGEDLGRRLARSFMEKTFDLTFHVTRPVLSDWNKYLDQQLNHVFGEVLKDGWSYEVGRIYERWSQGKEVTPRSINVTLNEIATLWLQWHGQGVSFVTVAYFAIFREEIGDEIAKEVSAPRIDISDHDPDWQRGLAALFFGATPDVAIQILIEPRLRQACKEWDEEAFKELAALPGFKEIFQRVLDVAQPVEPEFIGQATYLLSELAPEKSAWSIAAWATIRRLLLTARPWEELHEFDLDALVALLKNCPEANLRAFILGASKRLGSVLEQIIVQDADRKIYVGMASALVKSAKENGFPAVSIRVLGGPEVFLETISLAADEPALANSFRTASAAQQIVDVLANQISKGTNAENAEQKFRALLHRNSQVNWAPVLQSSRRAIQDQSASFASMPAAVSVLGHFGKSNETAQKFIKEAGESGALMARTAEFQTSSDYNQMARLVALSIISGTPLSQPNGVKWADIMTREPKFAAMVKIAIDTFGPKATLDLLVKAAEESGDVAILCRAITSLRIRIGALGTLYLDDILQKLDRYLDVFDANLHERFVRVLATYQTFWDRTAARPFDQNVQRVLKTLALSDTTLLPTTQRQKARKQLKERFQTVTTADWIPQVQNGGEILSLALTLAASQKTSLNVGQRLYDALQHLLPQLVTDENRPFGDRWFKAAGLLGQPARRALFLNLRDLVLKGGTPRLSTLLRLGGDDLLTVGQFAAENDAAIRHIIQPSLADAEGLAWMLENAATLKPWIVGSPRTVQVFLKEQLKHRWTEGDQTSRQRIASIAELWGVDDVTGKP